MIARSGRGELGVIMGPDGTFDDMPDDQKYDNGQWQAMRRTMSLVNRHWHAAASPEVPRSMVITSSSVIPILYTTRARSNMPKVKTLVLSLEPESATPKSIPAHILGLLALATQLHSVVLDLSASGGLWIGSIFRQGTTPTDSVVATPAEIVLAHGVRNLCLSDSSARLHVRLANSLDILAVRFTHGSMLSWFDGLRCGQLTTLVLGFEVEYADGPLDGLLAHTPRLKSLTFMGLADEELDTLFPPIAESSGSRLVSSLRHLSINTVSDIYLDFLDRVPASLTRIYVESAWRDGLCNLDDRLPHLQALKALKYLRVARYRLPSPESDVALRDTCARLGVQCDFNWEPDTPDAVENVGTYCQAPSTDLAQTPTAPSSDRQPSLRPDARAMTVFDDYRAL